MTATVVREFAEPNHCPHRQGSEARLRTLCFECFRSRREEAAPHNAEMSVAGIAPLRSGELTDREITHRHALLANLKRQRARAD